MTSIPKPWQSVPPRRATAFSLIELLAVIAVIGILAGMVGTATIRQVKSMDFSATVAEIGTLMEDARQAALVENRDVQVRVYRYPLTTDPTVRYRAMAIGKVIPISDPGDTGYGDPTQYQFETIGEIYRLPANIVFIDSASHSTLLTASSITTGFESVAAPDSSTPINAEYRAFHITPHEGATLDITATAPWTLTLGPRLDKNYASGLPVNFATFTVSPQTGKATLTRP